MIRCEFCAQVKIHDYRCPNYIPPKAKHYCCYCSEGMYQGQCYLDNQNGEYIHRDCIPNIDWLINWLGFKVEEMNWNYE